MEISLLFFLPLLSGFIFVSDFIFLRYKSAHTETQRLYYRAALYGFFFLIFATILHFCMRSYLDQYNTFINSLYQEKLFPLLQRPVSGSEVNSYEQSSVIRADVFVICVWTLLVGAATPFWNFLLRILDTIYLYIFMRGESLYTPIRKYNLSQITDDLDRILVTSIINETCIHVTLTNSQTYVGVVSATYFPEKLPRFFSLFPLLTGHINKDTSEDVLDTHPENIILIKGDGALCGLEYLARVVIPIDKVVCLEDFNLEEYVKKHS